MKPTRCVVIQLARLGDILQSLMALRAAKQLYPQLEITLVTRERFAAAAKRVPWLHEVIVLPTEQLVGPVITGEKSETEGVGDLARWLAPLVREPWDFVVNWTFSESSSFLTSLLPGRVRLGYTRRKDLTLSCPDGWSHYVQAVVQGGLDQNIHLTDILTTQLLTALQIHIGDPADAGNAPVTSKGFFSLNVGADAVMNLVRDLSRKWIGLQLGTGNETKTWDAENWAELAVYILNRHPECGIVLMGMGAEDERSASIVQEYVADLVPSLGARLVNVVSKTPFDSWAGLIGRCQWVIAGDTGAVHLASILGTRVLNVSVGPVRPAETGPYGNGHYVISSRGGCPACVAGSETNERHSCRHDVSSEAVYAAWSYASQEWSHRRQLPLEQHFDRLGFEKDLERIQILRSRIRGTQDGGGVVYEPLLERPMNVNEWTSQVMGHVARAWYCGWLPPMGQELDRKRIHPQIVQSLRQLEEASTVLIKICDEAKRTAQKLQARSLKLKSEKIMPLGVREEIQGLGRKLSELDQLIDRLASAQRPLLAFAQMSKVLMHNLRGEHLSELGRESAESYSQLNYGVGILRDWVRHTLEMARPKALLQLQAQPIVEVTP